MLEKLTLTKIRVDSDQLRPSLKETQDKVIALENYTRRENLRFMNISKVRDENCWDRITLFMT